MKEVGSSYTRSIRPMRNIWNAQRIWSIEIPLFLWHLLDAQCVQSVLDEVLDVIHDIFHRLHCLFTTTEHQNPSAVNQFPYRKSSDKYSKYLQILCHFFTAPQFGLKKVFFLRIVWVSLSQCCVCSYCSFFFQATCILVCFLKILPHSMHCSLQVFYYVLLIDIDTK